jgi:hypothetical protein
MILRGLFRRTITDEQLTGVSSTAINSKKLVCTTSWPPAGLWSSSLSGFRPQTFTDVQIGNSAQIRLNFALALATGAQTVEVTIDAANLITSSSSSVGEVLPEKQIQDLPLVSNNVLDLVGVMAGVRMTNDAIFGAKQTNLPSQRARRQCAEMDQHQQPKVAQRSGFARPG